MSPRNDDGQSGKKAGPAWRGNRKAAGKVKAAPDWKTHKPKDNNDEFKYRLKRNLLVICCVALFTAFVLYLFSPKNTPLIVFRASAYPLQFPPLALANEDEHFLTMVSPSNLPLQRSENSDLFSYSTSADNQSNGNGTPQRFLTRLSKVKPSGPGWGNKTVIIYIAAHGLVNEKGQACLVPPDADAFETSKWLELGGFLKDICKLDNLKGARKLVVLDCNRISMKWRSGVMDNRFADKLPDIVKDIGDPKLYVLNSTSPGQVGWAAPELRGSVFAHFLGRGLRGDASLKFPNDRSPYTVTLLELEEYLRANVDHYVRFRRGARQLPVVYCGPTGERLKPKDDVPLVAADWWLLWRQPEPTLADHNVLAQAKSLMQPSGKNKRSALQRAWEAYQRRAMAQADDRTSELPSAWRRGFVMDPIRWAAAEQKLLALEERLFAGADYQTKTLETDLIDVAAELSADDWHAFPKTQSVTNLRLERWQSLAAAPEDSSATDPNAPAPSNTPKTAEFGPRYDSYLTAPPEEKARILISDSERTRALRELLARFGLDKERDPQTTFEPFTFDRLASVLAFLRLPTNAPPVLGEQQLVEAHFLKLLGSSSSPEAERLLPDALRTRAVAEQAATPLDVRTHYALELLVQLADAERRAGDDGYWLGDQTALAGTASSGSDEDTLRNSAEQRWSRARGASDLQSDRIWEPDHRGYLAARRWGDRLGDMFVLRDEIWATLPYLAEWYFHRWRLELAAQAEPAKNYHDHVMTLTEVLDLNVTFAEELENLLSQRDSEDDLRKQLNVVSVAHSSLQIKWDRLRNLARTDSRAQSKAEKVFERGNEVRRIEQVMHTPLYAGARVPDLLSKYRLTLEDWAGKMPEPKGRASGAAKATAPADQQKAADKDSVADTGKLPDAASETEFLEGYRTFLSRYRRVLAYQFRTPFEKDLEPLQLEPLAIDRQLRQPPAQEKTIWNTLRGLLVEYNTSIGAKPVDVGETARGDRARAELSIWDRRVRASACWLCCFNARLNAPTQGRPTPAAWLREVDHWHLTCWHGHRLLQDFWGNGLPNDKNKQFFDLATEHCSETAQLKGLPFQYDVPGAKVVKLEALHAARNVAHQFGLEVQVDPVQTSATAPAKGDDFHAKTTQRIESPTRKAADLSGGVAGFYLSRAGAIQQLDDTLVEYEGNRALRRARVKLEADLSNQPGPRPIAGKIKTDNLGGLPASLEGRVWYRGHVWSHPFDVYRDSPKTGIKFVHRRETYSAPTVVVEGDDAPSGAIFFVFDCSTSMMNADGRFAAAHDALTEIVADLKKNAAGLKVGLIAYGHRTPHRAFFPAPFNKMYWKHDQRWNDQDPLTAEGKALGAGIAKFPHPDLDIETLLAPKAGWDAEIDGKLALLTVNSCFGVTPLYASLSKALQEISLVEGVASKQIIVLSDGVNMPNACDVKNGVLWPAGRAQNSADLEALIKINGKSPKVNVRVVLFGGVNPGLEAQQLAALEAVGKEPQFVVDRVSDIKEIKKSIMAAFAKPDFEVVAEDRERPSLGRKPFKSTWTYPQWPTSGDLLVPQPHQIVVRGPRLATPLREPIKLGGAEALLARYQAASSTLEFDPGKYDRYDESPLEARAGYSGPDLQAMLQTLKPDVGSPIGEIRPTTFRLRMGSDSHRGFIPWPRHVWAEIKPLDPPARYKDLNFQIADLKFEDKTRTPILHFPVPNWPIAVEGAELDVWLRYTSPQQYPTTNISPVDPQLRISGSKYGLDGVEFVMQQQIQEGASRKITITERHSDNTQLSNLYRTRVLLSPPADVIERLYLPPSATSFTSEVVHTFYYSTPVYLNANLTLDITTDKQIKDGALRATVKIKGWNR